MIWVESINKREKGIIWIFKIHIKISCKCLLQNGEFNLMGVALGAYKKYFLIMFLSCFRKFTYKIYLKLPIWVGGIEFLTLVPFLLTDKKISISFWIVIGKNNKNRLSWLMLQSYGIPKTTLQNFAMRMNLQHTIFFAGYKSQKGFFSQWSSSWSKIESWKIIFIFLPNWPWKIPHFSAKCDALWTTPFFQRNLELFDEMLIGFPPLI